MMSMLCGRAAVACVAVSFVVGTDVLAGVSLPQYSLVGQFELPGAGGVWDVLPDGRLIALQGDGSIVRQAAIGSSNYDAIGAIDAGLLGSFGPGFLRVDPTGQRFAIGDGVFGAGASVYFGEVADLSTGSPTSVQGVQMQGYAAHWRDAQTLYVSGAAGDSGVTEINAQTLDSRLVIANIGGASGGVVTDGQWLYTGNGFDFDPGSGSITGDVYAFSLSAIDTAGTPIDFEAQGVLVGNALSAGSLAIDALGNLAIGGSQFGNPAESGFAAVLSAEAVAQALLGMPAGDEWELRLDPGMVTDGYEVRFNAATNEMLLAANGVVHRYAIPAPGASMLFAGGLLAAMRRRRAEGGAR